MSDAQNLSGGTRIIINAPKQPQVQSVKVVGATSFGVTGAENLRDLRDVDTSHLADGEVLVYDEASGKYIIEVLPLIDGGSF